MAIFRIASLLIFLCQLTVISSAQVPPPLVEKSEFNPSGFGGKQTLELMDQLLREDLETLSDDITHYNIEVKDLYYEYSRKYEHEQKIEPQFKYDYLTSEDEVNEELKQLRNDHAKIKKGWIESLKQTELAKSILWRLKDGATMEVSDQTITIIIAFRNSTYLEVLTYHFDENDHLKCVDYGSRSAQNSRTKFSKRVEYTFKKTSLIATTELKFFDYNSDPSTTQIQRLIETRYEKENTVQILTCYFNKAEDSAHFEMVEDFYHSKSGDLDSSVLYEKNSHLRTKSIAHIVKTTYINNRPVMILNTLLLAGKEFYGKEETVYSYDDEGRRIGVKYSSWDKDNTIQNSRVESIAYHPNKLIYIYKELVPQYHLLPLEYQTTFTFYKK